MKIKNIFSSILIVLTFAVAALAQSGSTQLKNRCPNTSIYSIVLITGVGDIQVQPCPNKTTTFTQTTTIPKLNADLTDGTAAAPSLAFTTDTNTGVYHAGTDIFGISTAGVANTTFGAVVNTARSAKHTFSNVAGTAQFDAEITPSDTVGVAIIGDCAIGAPTSCVSVDQSGKSITLAGTFIRAGDFNASANGTELRITDASKTILLNTTAGTGILDTAGVNTIKYQRTITPGGTTGAQTIDKPAGTLNVAAGQSSIVLTNSTIGTDSLPFLTLRTADTTCTFVKSAVTNGGAHTLTITLNAACNAETSIGFLITN